MKNKKRRGVLLLEAIVGIALLAAGVGAAATAFSSTRDALRRGDRDLLLGNCAQQKILSELTDLSIDSDCSKNFSWNQQREPLSPRLEKISWTATWKENGSAHEETFETIR